MLTELLMFLMKVERKKHTIMSETLKANNQISANFKGRLNMRENAKNRR